METIERCPECDGPFISKEYSTPIYQGFTERAKHKKMKMLVCENCHLARIVEEW